MTLGDIIKQYREKQKISMDAFAEKSGISKAYISLLEKNKHPKTGKPIAPSIKYIKQVADAIGVDFNDLFSIIDGDVTLNEKSDLVEDRTKLPKAAFPINNMHRIPILGYISAGLPIYAEQHIEGYTYTELNGGAEYFALRVKGDSMNALRICDGDIIIVRRQKDIENGDIAVVLVDNENATVKQFFQEGNKVTLVPRSTNPEYAPQFYDLQNTQINILGKVVRNQIDF